MLKVDARTRFWLTFKITRFTFAFIMVPLIAFEIVDPNFETGVDAVDDCFEFRSN